MGRILPLLNTHWSPDFRYETWRSKAQCLLHPKLPWTQDWPPFDNEHDRMAAVCADCPVISECGDYALNSNYGHGVEGGFYAGTWIPWRAFKPTAEMRNQRRNARRRLRHQLTLVKEA